MTKTKSHKINDLNQPEFSDEYKVLEQVVLNLTNIDGNNNKFYSMELQQFSYDFRIFTHYGRVGEYGTKEGRYFLKSESKKKNDADNRALEEIAKDSAKTEFNRILKSKKKKGYVPIEFAKTDVGSETAKQINETKPNKKKGPSCFLNKRVENFVEQIYEEASRSLAKIIKTPLGALSGEQIDKGYERLAKIRKALIYGDDRILAELSSEFYSLIPQNFPRKINPLTVIIDSKEKADRQEELLQLMKDVYNVKDDLGSDVYVKYKAINTTIKPLSPKEDEYQRIAEKVRKTQSSHHDVDLKISNIFEIDVSSAKERFNPKNLRTMELFHGSANKNILGILERGLLISPPCATFSGAAFGRGIYFASNSTKSAQYSTKFYNNIYKNGFLFLADVAVGRMQKVRNFTFNDNGPALGYDSVMGIKGADLIHDEYIVYNVNQVELIKVIDYTPKTKRGFYY